MIKRLRDVLREPDGATAVEYGLICAVIVVAAIGAIVGLGNKVTLVWNNVATEVTTH